MKAWGIRSREQWRLFTADPIFYTKTRPELVLSPLLFIVTIATWAFVTSYFRIPIFVLPPPDRVLRSLVTGLTIGFNNPQGFYYHAVYTVAEGLLGFLIGSIFGIMCGTAVALSRVVDRTLYPYIIAFQALPKVAIAPLFVIWFGFGLQPKIVVTAIICFFPLLVNTISGIRSVEQDRIDLARSLCASQWQIFTKVTFPSSLPFIFAGLHMAVVLSLLGAIIGEFVGAQRGLGVLILRLNFMMDIPGVYAVLIVLGVLGTAFHQSMRALEKKVVFWTSHEVRAVGA